MIENDDSLAVEFSQLQDENDELGDKMLFDTPEIWLEYKVRAYQPDLEINSKLKKRRREVSESINTWGDLINHTRRDGICKKRFDFLKRIKRWNEKSFEDYTNLLDIIDQFRVDEGSLNTWREHEYYSEGKWKDYAI